MKCFKLLIKKFKIPISRRFEIFTKTSHLKLVGTPCIKFFRTKIGTKLWKTKKKSLEIRTWLHIPKLWLLYLIFSRGLKFSLHFCNRVLTCFLSFLAELSSPTALSAIAERLRDFRVFFRDIDLQILRQFVLNIILLIIQKLDNFVIFCNNFFFNFYL